MSRKNIAVLTSGGDSPGMNAAIRSVVRTAIKNNVECFGICNGWEGLINHQISFLTWDDVSGIIKLGGTIIRTARCPEFKNDILARRKAVHNLLKLGVDKLVVVGGDGSLTGASVLSLEWKKHIDSLVEDKMITRELGDQFPELRISGLVGSIDNDFYGSSMMIGCDTAMHRIVFAIDSILTTAYSHHRAFVIEVMGRDSGYLALMSGIVTSSDWILVPELPPQEGWEDTMCEAIKKNNQTLINKKHIIVIVSEGARDFSGKAIKSEYVREVLQTKLKVEARCTILGHIQRGGSPSFYDRYIATCTGSRAVQDLFSDEKKEPVVVGMNGWTLVESPLIESVRKTREVVSLLQKGDIEAVFEIRGHEFREMMKLTDYIQRPVSKNEVGLKIGLINIGASSPGMNCCVKTVVQAGLHSGLRIFGISHSLSGLVNGNVKEMSWEDVYDWETQGGSFLGTNRVTLDEIGITKVVDALSQFDGLIMIGGFDGHHDMHEINSVLKKRIPIVCIPATISNNIPGTEVSVGFDTSLNSVISACDNLCNSYVSDCKRLYMVEVPGNYCGALSLFGSISSGAAACYIHEDGMDLKRIVDDVDRLNKKFIKERQIMIVIVNERTDTLYSNEFLTKIYDKETNHDVTARDVKLGHIVCGGNPTPLDRINASRFGLAAVEYLAKGSTDSIILGLSESQLVHTPLSDFVKLSNLKLRRPKTQWWSNLKSTVTDLSSLYK